MKVTAEHLAGLQEAMDRRISNQGAVAIRMGYVEQKLTYRRMMWDIYWMLRSRGLLDPQSGPDYNDEHIETALFHAGKANGIVPVGAKPADQVCPMKSQEG